jgi:hypothetical protein
MFHATFVAKHVKIIVETSIINHCNIEQLQKIKECNITNFHLQHWKKAFTNLATSKNLHQNIMGYLLQHGKKHLQILQHPKISIETSRDTYCNMEKRASVAEPRQTTTREAPPPQQGSAGLRRAMSKPRWFRSSAPGLRCSSPSESRRGAAEELVRTKLPTAAPHEAPTTARSSPDGAPTALALQPRAEGAPRSRVPGHTPGRGGHDDRAPGLGEQRATLDHAAARAFDSAPPPSSQHPLPRTGCIRGERERDGDDGRIFWGTKGMSSFPKG